MSKVKVKSRLTRESTIKNMVVVAVIIVVVVTRIVIVIVVIETPMGAAEANVVIEVAGIGRDHSIVMATTTTMLRMK
jgi:hypothetical protein